LDYSSHELSYHTRSQSYQTQVENVDEDREESNHNSPQTSEGNRKIVDLTQNEEQMQFIDDTMTDNNDQLNDSQNSYVTHRTKVVKISDTSSNYTHIQNHNEDLQKSFVSNYTDTSIIR
jgi:hypothetical protein